MMTNTEVQGKTTILPLAGFFYELLLLLYPEKHCREYASEMRMVFYDLYDEHLKKGKLGLGFWLMLIADVLKSTAEQHLELARKLGGKEYLAEVWNLNLPAVIGLILFLPFLSLAWADFTSMVLTGSHNSLSWLYNSPAWRGGRLPFILLLVMPGLAVVLNSIYLLSQNKSKPSIRTHFFNVLILALGIGLGVLIFGHDMIPCTITQVLRHGLLRLLNGIQYCRVAY